MLGTSESSAGPTGVLVAADLTPAEAAELDPSRVAAVLLAFGSPHAHNVILLRAKGIPVVVGAGPTVLSIPDGTIVAVDGGRGEFVVDPPDRCPCGVSGPGRDARTASAPGTGPRRRARGHPRRRHGRGRRERRLGGRRTGGGGPRRGFRGLVRTEFLFLGRQDAPDVEEQLAVYRKIAESLDGRRITLRTLDVGGDKPLEFLPTPAEMNPFLGVRGIRLSLAHPELLADQLLAMVRLAQQTRSA